MIDGGGVRGGRGLKRVRFVQITIENCNPVHPGLSLEDDYLNLNLVWEVVRIERFH